MNQSTTNLRRRWIAAFSALWTALLCATPLHAIEAVGETPASDNESGIQIALPEGLPTADWLSIRAVYEAGRHAFEATDGGWQARNPGQQWETFFDRRGFLVEPQGGGWQWGLELCRYGFPGAERLVGGTPAVKAEGQRLTYDWDDAVQEWFVNDARGLEHGFTVRERPNRPEGPQTRSNSLLRFTLTTRGTLAPHVANDAQSVTYQDAAGAAVLTYSGLKVWDADGKVLPSGFETTGKEGVYLWVDEHGARYPLTIDPIAQQAYLKAHQVSTIDFFGSSVASSGDTVVVGSISEDSSTTGINSTPNESGNAAGAAYVFVRNGTTWTQQAYLKATTIGAGTPSAPTLGARWQFPEIRWWSAPMAKTVAPRESTALPPRRTTCWIREQPTCVRPQRDDVDAAGLPKG
ncbi:MAG: FG-GAP repeat protein [Verrucomicrobiales bacterium]